MIKLVKKVLPYFKSTWIYPRAKYLSGGGGILYKNKSMKKFNIN